MDTMQKPRTTPKDFFLQFGALIALYVSAGSLLSLLFTVVNRAFPDAIDLNYYASPSVYSSGMRFAIASLVIVFPTYIILSWLITGESEAKPEKKTLSLRRWLTYLTLFAATALALGDLITLINYFLGGEISVRFILKVVAVIVVSVGVFFYYLYDLRRTTGELKRFKIYAIVSAVVVLISVIVGFAIMGLPQSQRDAQFDSTRISHLQSIQSEIVFYYQQKATVPSKLDELSDKISSYMLPVDPETNLPYQYEKVSTNTFKLCGNFSTSNKYENTAVYKSVPVPGSAISISEVSNQNWKHDKGNVCFSRLIDPEFYPVIKK